MQCDLADLAGLQSCLTARCCFRRPCAGGLQQQHGAQRDLPGAPAFPTAPGQLGFGGRRRAGSCRSSTAQPGSRDLEQQHREPKLRRWLVPGAPACSGDIACLSHQSYAVSKRSVKKEESGAAVRGEQRPWRRSWRSHRIPGLLPVLLVALGLPCL